MIGGWLVECAINYGGNGVAYMERLGAATTSVSIREAELTGKITAQEAAYLRLQRQVEATSARRAQMFRNVSAGVAVVGALGIADAVVQASKLQRTLIAIRNETGANSDAMERFYNTTFKIANVMGVSPAVAGNVMLNISRLTAGIMATRQMQQIAPTVAGFASTINFNRPDVSVEEATQAGIQMSHMFRAYNPTALTSLLDKVYRLSGLMVEKPAQAVRQLSYFAPLFKGVGINDETTIAMMALLDRAGFRQKVGTNVRAMMLQELGPLQLTKHYQEGQGKILEQMGVFRSGKFAFNLPGGGTDFIGMLHSVAEWANRQEKAGTPKTVIAKDIYGALGKQGGTIGLLMADPQMIGILNQISGYMHNSRVSLASGEQNRQGSIEFQASRVWGNFQADLTELGYRATWASGTLKTVADDLHNLQEWMHGHPVGANWIAGGAVLVTGVAALGAAAGIAAPGLRLVVGGLRGLTSPLAGVARGVGTLGANSLGASSSISSLGGAILRLAGPIGAILGLLAIGAAATKDAFKRSAGKDSHVIFQGGANYGATPTNTQGTVNVFGAPLPGYHSPGAYVPPLGTASPSHHAINQLNRALNPTRQKLSDRVAPNSPGAYVPPRGIVNAKRQPAGPLKRDPGAHVPPRGAPNHVLAAKHSHAPERPLTVGPLAGVQRNQTSQVRQKLDDRVPANHFAKVEIHIHGVKDGPDAAEKVASLWNNPMSQLYRSSKMRTAAHIPDALTVVPV